MTTMTTTLSSATRTSQPSSRQGGTTPRPGGGWIQQVKTIITMLRFWQNKIHQDTDRRQTKSTIEFGSDGDSVKDPGEVAGGSRTEDEVSKDGETEEEDEVRELGDYTYGGGQV